MRNKVLLAPSTALLFGLSVSSSFAQSNVALNNNGSIGQDGSNNAATITQADAIGGEVSIDQIGQGHRATVSDTGTESLLELDQSGAAQTATIRLSGQGSGGSLIQDGGIGDVAEIESVGGVNSFTVLQSTVAPGTLTGNRLGLVQSGDLNSAIQTQRGFDNTMNLQQTGVSNFADMQQDGSGNNMRLVQNGVGNEITWTQTGTNLPDLGITQSDGMQFTVAQQSGG